MFGYIGVWIAVILLFLAMCIFARYIIKKSSQGQPLIPDKVKGEDFDHISLKSVADKARPGLAAPLSYEEIINTPVKVTVSFDEKGEKFLNLDIILIRRNLDSIEKSLKEIAQNTKALTR